MRTHQCEWRLVYPDRKHRYHSAYTSCCEDDDCDDVKYGNYDDDDDDDKYGNYDDDDDDKYGNYDDDDNKYDNYDDDDDKYDN
jgi:hypothetical protein